MSNEDTARARRQAILAEYAEEEAENAEAESAEVQPDDTLASLPPPTGPSHEAALEALDAARDEFGQ